MPKQIITLEYRSYVPHGCIGITFFTLHTDDRELKRKWYNIEYKKYNEIKDLSGSAVFSNDHFFYQGNLKETTTETYFKKCQQPDSKWYYELTPVDWVFQLLYPNNLNDLVNVVNHYDY